MAKHWLKMTLATKKQSSKNMGVCRNFCPFSGQISVNLKQIIIGCISSNISCRHGFIHLNLLLGG